MNLGGLQCSAIPIYCENALYYNITNPAEGRMDRKWLEYPLTQEADGTYTAIIPADIASSGISWFANAEDKRFGENGGLCGGTYVYEVQAGGRM